ncbi:hypothetical protein [Desulfococcus sp.]|uniref:hypothetical protein n=1 Tax=Desulfococcus sp. TaxID=2025834 RepID=UPI003593D517
MILSLGMIEGQNFSEDVLWSLSLGNAKQLLVGSAYGFGAILHIAAEDADDLGNSLREFAKLQGVTGVVTLALRTEA